MLPCSDDWLRGLVLSSPHGLAAAAAGTLLGGFLLGAAVVALYTFAALPAAEGRRTRTALHFPRRFFHAFNGVVAIYKFLLVTNPTPKLSASHNVVEWDLGDSGNFHLGIGLVFGFCVVCEALKLSVPAFRDAGMRLTARIVRPHEASRFSGVAYYVGGCWLTIWACENLRFGPAVAPGVATPLRLWAMCAALTALAVGDPIAAMAGTAFAHSHPNGRGVVGRKLRLGRGVADRAAGKSPAASLFAAGVNGAIALAFAWLFFVCAPSAAGATASVALPAMAPTVAGALTVGLAGAMAELMVASPYPCLPFSKFPLGPDDNAIIGPIAALGAAAALGGAFAFSG